MSTEGASPLMNQSGGYYGAELAIHERIRSVQSQIRIAIQNHHLLYTRSQALPKDPELENHMKILQDLIMSLGRTQLELMYQFKMEIKEKHGVSDLKNVMAMFLGWPDRHEVMLYNGKENGTAADKEKKAQIMKRKPLLPPLARPKVKMQSLLKVNHSKSILPTKKESERLKAASKQPESPYSVMKEAKKLQSVLKARNEKLGHASSDFAKQPNESGDADLKDPLSSDSIKIEDRATSIDEVTQDSFLRFFGLIHKDKSKNMVVTQTKRKRRSAAGQTSFYGDFSYFQAKRTYTKKAVVSSSVPESPSSSQDVVDADENDRLSLTSTDKPSEPTSPEIPSSQEVVASQEMATSQETDVGAEGPGDSEGVAGSCKLIVVGANQAKKANDGDSDGITEPPESEDVPQSPGEKTYEDGSPTKAVDIESSALLKDESREPQAASNEGQTDTKSLHAESVLVEKMITEDGDDVEACETEILLGCSPETSAVEVMPPFGARAMQKPASALGDPPLLLRNGDSMIPESSLQSKKQEVCSVCLESSDLEVKGCSVCGDYYHKECASNPGDSCPSCHAIPTSISSIVGVNTASTLTSTDCFEVVKRYLDDSQEDSQVSGDSRDDEDSKESANTIDCNSEDGGGSDPTEAFSCEIDGKDVDAVDSVDDQDDAGVNDSDDDVANDGANRVDEDNLLDNDDSLGFPNPSLFEDNSCNSSSLL